MRSDFVQQQNTVCDFSNSDSWVILSPIELSIKKKIEAVGTPLKDWDINIYRGVLTGCNEAFIIDTAKRKEILNKCESEDERKRTDELIRPILRGRDIKRYGYEWADMWLIATFPARHYDIEEYSAVKEYLLSFAKDYLNENGNQWVAKDYLADFCKQKLDQTGDFIRINGKYIFDDKGNKEKGRKKTSNKWFETQDSISYWEDFFKPRIVYREIGLTMDACLLKEGWMINNKLYMISGSHLSHLIHYFNSKLFNSMVLSNANLTGGKGIDFMEKVLVPLPSQCDLSNCSINEIDDILNDYPKIRNYHPIHD